MKKRTRLFCLLWAATFGYTQAARGVLHVSDADTGKKVSVQTQTYEPLNDACLDRSKLPFDLNVGKNDPPVERPAFDTFVLEGRLDTYENSPDSEDNFIMVEPGLSVSWGEPASESARKHVKGYALVWSNGDEVVPFFCQIFKVVKSKLQQKIKLKFNYELVQIYEDFNYEVRLFSLPPPTTWMNGTEKENFVSLNITLGTSTRNYTNTGIWKPSIAVKHGEGSITVNVVHPPKEFNLTEYHVMLLRYGDDPASTVETKRYLAPPYSEQKSGFITFDGLTVSGDYKVKVQIIDPFPTIQGRCLCYLSDEGDRVCTKSCASISSQWAPLVIEEVGLSTEDPVKSTTESTSTLPEEEFWGMAMAGRPNKPVESPRQMMNVITTAIVATGTTLALVLLILSALFLTRRSKSQPAVAYQKVAHPPAKEMLANPGDQIGPMETPTVYIIHAEDHPGHMKAVENFATFLSVHGKCKVIFAPWQDIKSAGITRWSSYALQRADYLLFIDSVAAEHQLSGFNARRVYEPVKSQCNQLLRLARDYVYNVPGAKARVCVVHFRRDCGSQRFLAAPHMFHLPSGIPALLQCIHGLSSKQAQALSYTLHAGMDYSKLPEGASFLASIKASDEYEGSHPNWFEERYGRAKLEYRMVASKRVEETPV